MMEKETSTKKSLLRALYLLPLICISLALNAQTKVSYVSDDAQSDQTPKALIAKMDGDDTLNIKWAVQDYQLPEGSSFDDLVGKLPGVQTDENGTITVNGKPISRVLFDGNVVYENQDANTPDHTVHMNYSRNDPDYITYSDTVYGFDANGSPNELISRGMFRADAKTVRLDDEKLNMNMSISVPDGTNIEELIQTLPGIEIDNDGNITVNGKKVNRILVNGQELRSE